MEAGKQQQEKKKAETLPLIDNDPCVSDRKVKRVAKDQPRLMSHKMYHRHPSLAQSHFHNPSLSDEHPFPWLEEGKMYRQLHRHRSESVFAASKKDWNHLIERHLTKNRKTASCSSQEDFTEGADDVFSSKEDVRKVKKTTFKPDSLLGKAVEKYKKKAKVKVEVKRENFSVKSSLAGEKIEKRLKMMTGSNSVFLCDEDYRDKIIQILKDKHEEQEKEHEDRLERQEVARSFLESRKTFDKTVKKPVVVKKKVEPVKAPVPVKKVEKVAPVTKPRVPVKEKKDVKINLLNRKKRTTKLVKPSLNSLPEVAEDVSAKANGETKAEGRVRH